MANSAGIAAKWHAFWENLGRKFAPVKQVFDKIGKVIGIICKWIYRLRGGFLAIPVVILAFKMAMFNLDNLPELVGLNLLSSGEFGWMVGRSTAVYGPLFLTGACLVLMLGSRRPLYPWIVSLFTLALPLLILATNNFDGLMLLLG